MKKGVFIGVVVLLLIALGVSAFMVGSYLVEGKQQEDRYNELSQIAGATRPAETTAATQAAEVTEAAETVESTANAEPTEPTEIPGYAEIHALNSDTVGWIKIEGTQVDYPVMQASNNDYYLYRDFDKKSSQRGSIFADAAADVNEPSDNITLYGHCMADGSMFFALNNYVEKSYWEDNSLIFFDTINEYHTYKIFAVFKTSANVGEGYSYHKFVDAENAAEFDAFVNKVKSLSFYDTGVTPVYGDKLITLSTCEYTLDNGRLVVCAVRIS